MNQGLLSRCNRTVQPRRTICRTFSSWMTTRWFAWPSRSIWSDIISRDDRRWRRGRTSRSRDGKFDLMIVDIFMPHMRASNPSEFPRARSDGAIDRDVGLRIRQSQFARAGLPENDPRTRGVALPAQAFTPVALLTVITNACRKHARVHPARRSSANGARQVRPTGRPEEKVALEFMQSRVIAAESEDEIQRA